MHVEQSTYTHQSGWSKAAASLPDAHLVLAFGNQELLSQKEIFDDVRRRYPDARLVSCSSGGEIAGDRVLDGGLVLTAARLRGGSVSAAAVELKSPRHSEAAGRELAARLSSPGLRHVLIFSEGLAVNGTALAAGLAGGLPTGVSVTGGLAADGERFAQTGVGLDSRPLSGRVVAVGLHGERLQIGMGSLGEWERFGTEYRITRSEDNVLYELDGEPALAVYQRVLAARAFALPASGLLFPLHVREPGRDSGVVRTLLGVDRKQKSVTFAGDVPVGRLAQMMRANLDRLIDASGTAARTSAAPLAELSPQLVLLVSCIGRKLLLQRRVEEEIASARRIFGPASTFAGFYSYGEISPMTPSARCELHNQTMTITALGEA